MDRRQRFTVVDGLRGLAALAVVLYHAGAGGHVTELLAALPGSVGACVARGHLGVAVFFVLSGFVVAHTLHGTRMTLRTLGRFALRRSLRLDPPYWAAILLVVGAGLAASAAGAERAAPGVTRILAHLLYLQDVLGMAPISGVFWTLCLEVQFYLGYALLLLVGRNAPGRPLQGRRTAALLAAAGVVSLLWPLGIGPALPDGLFPPLWHGFLLGVGAYWAWREPACRGFVAACTAAIAAGAWFTGSEFSAVCAATALGLFAAARTGWLTGGLDWRWLQGLGLVSYSLYLTHNTVTGAVFRAGARLTGQGVLPEALWLVASVLACVAFAALLWWAVERPSMALARRVRPVGPRGEGEKPGAPVPGLVPGAV
jgi:peptidoglycan/LPS O-acetylase OafA/YrhL